MHLAWAGYEATPVVQDETAKTGGARGRLRASKQVDAGDVALGDCALPGAQHSVGRRCTGLNEHPSGMLEPPPNFFDLPEQIRCAIVVPNGVGGGTKRRR